AQDAGRHDEWDVEPGLLEDLERLAAAEARHDAVGDDEVPDAAPEGLGHGLGGLHALEGDGITAALELPHEEVRVVLVVLDDENCERAFHRALASSLATGRGRAGWALSAGARVQWMVAPPPGLAAAQIRPPWRCTIR